MTREPLPTGGPRLRTFAVVQTIVCVALAAVWFHVRTEARLAGPPDPDLFAQSRSFQWLAFAVFWLPAILVLDAVVRGIVRDVLCRRDRVVVLRAHRRRRSAT